MTKDTGGPAFAGAFGSDGMDLRDWFAGKAMQGRLSLAGWELEVLFGEKADNPKGHKNEAERVAYLSYLMADAMISERSK